VLPRLRARPQGSRASTRFVSRKVECRISQKLPTWADKAHIHAVVKTPRGSHCKLEYDPKHRAFTPAKPLLAWLRYPYDWGFIPSTAAEDGDPPTFL
jgi:inorganic pyrophosphatase